MSLMGIQIITREFVTPLAVRLRSLLRNESDTTEQVDFVGNRLEVAGVDAGSVSTQMVDH